MQLLHAASELTPRPQRVCLAIGVFDGVHLGHQQVIRQTLADAEQHEARAVVITFDRHPNTVVAPDRVPPLIYSLPQKLRAIASQAVDATLLIRFDEAFSRQSGEQFIRGLVRDFGHLCSISVGSTFTFGHKRSGNVTLLKSLGQELKFGVHGLAAVALDGQMVSSTRIRGAIRSGELDAASQMLGRGYALSGPVVKGDGLGRQIGFPTANVDTAGLVLPPAGVYAVHVRDLGVSPTLAGVGLEYWSDGVMGTHHSTTPALHYPVPSHRAVLNIGWRPTLQCPTPQLRVEAHLLDFSGDLHGHELEITFVERLRDEQKFPSLEALKAQIAQDISAARRIFEEA